MKRGLGGSGVCSEGVWALLPGDPLLCSQTCQKFSASRLLPQQGSRPHVSGSLLPALWPGRWPEGSRLDVLIGWKTGPVGIASGSGAEQCSRVRPGMRLGAPRSRQPRGRSVWPLPLQTLRVLKVCPFRETKPRYFPFFLVPFQPRTGKTPGWEGWGSTRAGISPKSLHATRRSDLFPSTI